MNLFEFFVQKIKSKIIYLLLFYFSLSLSLFAIITGTVFTYVHKENMIKFNTDNLTKRAERISDLASTWWYSDTTYKNRSLNDFTNNSSLNALENNRNRQKNMEIIDAIAIAEVWIIDKDSETILQGSNKNSYAIPYRHLALSKRTKEIIKEALNGHTVKTTDFSNVLNQQTLTIAVPIYYKGTSITKGAVLLHSSLKNISAIIFNDIVSLFFYTILSFSIAFLLAISLSFRFTKPLDIIRNTALELNKGNYRAKTGLKSKDEIGHLAFTIDELAEKLYIGSKERENFEKLRNDFLANISHELRTPITVIRGSLEAITDGIVTDEETLKEFHEQILADAIHLQRLINDLIDITTLQNSSFSIHKNTIYLTELLNDVVRSMKNLANKKKINIHLNFNSKLKSRYNSFVGDYQRIRQMIIIILDNAIKFSNENKNIYIDFFNDKEYSILTIRDEGRGISKENIDKIFDRFYKTNIDNIGGSGLGLAIASQIALRHNIKIDVDSDENVGTTFTFYLPITQED